MAHPVRIKFAGIGQLGCLANPLSYRGKEKIHNEIELIIY